MFKSFEYEGYWWLPERKDRRIPGTLRFSQEKGGVLGLLGSFDRIAGTLDKKTSYDIVFGYTSDGKEITLEDCIVKSGHLHIPGMYTAELKPQKIYEGGHFRDPGLINIVKISAKFRLLAEWLNIPSIKHEFKTRGEGRTRSIDRISIEYNRPEDITIELEGVSTIRIEMGPKVNGNRHEVFLKQEAQLVLETPGGRVLSGTIELLLLIFKFFSFAVTYPVLPESLSAEIKSYDVPDHANGLNEKTLRIFWKIPAVRSAPADITAYDMLFSYEDIKEDFSNYLMNWVSKYEILEPVYNLYIDVLFNPNIHLQNRFLSLAQAFEVYHRRLFPGKYVSEIENDKIYAALTSYIPCNVEPDFKNRILDYLKYLNEYSLRKRLKEIIAKYKKHVNIQIKNTRNFIDGVYYTRNYLTHYDKGIREKTLKGKDLLEISENLKFLVEICLLSELGFPEDKITELVSKDTRYDFIRKPGLFD